MKKKLKLLVIPMSIILLFLLINVTGCIQTNEVITFGSYPQSRVTDEYILNKLSAYNDYTSWTPYPYYYDGKLQNYMYYKDVEILNQKYRGVFFELYRPYDANSGDTSGYHLKTHYDTRSYYWFKYEPIRWHIVEEDSSYATLVCEVILDSQAFQNKAETNSQDYAFIPGTNYYANNYKESTINTWLNTDFYSTAFDDKEKTLIQPTLLDNGEDSTYYEIDDFYLCETFLANIYLLSTAEMIALLTPATREKYPTDYAVCQGLEDNMWWLRSPSDWSSSYAQTCEDKFYAFKLSGHIWANVNNTTIGVVPALRINMAGYRGAYQ